MIYMGPESFQARNIPLEWQCTDMDLGPQKASSKNNVLINVHQFQRNSTLKERKGMRCQLLSYSNFELTH